MNPPTVHRDVRRKSDRRVRDIAERDDRECEPSQGNGRAAAELLARRFALSGRFGAGLSAPRTDGEERCVRKNGTGRDNHIRNRTVEIGDRLGGGDTAPGAGRHANGRFSP